MAKPKKNTNKPSEQNKASLTNVVVSTIISEDQELVATASKRRVVATVQRGEMVTVRNKMNGAINKLATMYAVKLVSRSADVYEILQ